MRKVIKAAAINQAVCALKVDCVKLEDDLRQVQNDCTVLPWDGETDYIAQLAATVSTDNPDY